MGSIKGSFLTLVIGILWCITRHLVLLVGHSWRRRAVATMAPSELGWRVLAWPTVLYFSERSTSRRGDGRRIGRVLYEIDLVRTIGRPQVYTEDVHRMLDLAMQKS
jgi:hypothetical protein